LFGLAQGYWPHAADPANAGLPAAPGTGSLVTVNEDREFEIVVDGLNQPTSLEIIGNDAYVVTLTGEVLKIANVLPGYRHYKKYHHYWH
jgi:hypothetical protein